MTMTLDKPPLYSTPEQACTALGTALARLADGASVADVAQRLTELGISGEPGCSSRCPIAVYVARATGLQHVTVAASGVTAIWFGIDSHYSNTPHDRMVAAKMPLVLADFVMAFDMQGLYSELWSAVRV